MLLVLRNLTRGFLLSLCIAITGGFAFASTAGALQQQPSSGSQQPAPKQQPSDSSSSSSASDSNVPDASAYNPLPAEKDVEVASFYMHKGDPDAAIPRLEDAIRVKPDYAKPRLLLAQIYEKKGDKQDAVKYYREYLQVFPHAPDAKKVQEKIDKLSKS